MPLFVGVALAWLFSVTMLILGLSRHRSLSLIQSRLSYLADEKAAALDEQQRRRYSVPHLYRALVAPLFARLGTLAAWTTPTLDNLERQLQEAGHPMHMQAMELLGLKVFAALVGGGLALLTILLLPGVPFNVYLLAPALLALPMIAFVIPNFVLRSMANGRRREIRLALPDMLDLLIINLEAGVGLDGAIYRAVERLKMPLTDELNRVLVEVQAGKPRIKSLREMAERLRIEDLSLIIACIQQSEQLGTGIGSALKAQADQMRKRRSNELRELAAKLPTKLLFPIVFFIFPTLFLVLLGPGAIMIIRSGAF